MKCHCCKHEWDPPVGQTPCPGCGINTVWRCSHQHLTAKVSYMSEMWVDDGYLTSILGDCRDCGEQVKHRTAIR